MTLEGSFGPQGLCERSSPFVSSLLEQGLTGCCTTDPEGTTAEVLEDLGGQVRPTTGILCDGVAYKSPVRYSYE